MGLVYLATVPGLLLRMKVVGYAMADHMRTDLVCEAIDMAVRNHKPTRGVTVFHSDLICFSVRVRFWAEDQTAWVGSS